MYIRFTKSVHLHYRTRVFTLSNTHIRPPFRVYFPICGHDKSDPYSCERIAIMLLTVCNNAANKLQYTHVHPRKTILSQRKYPLFALQKPYFRITKTYFSQRKYPLFALQKPYFRITKTYFSQRKYPLLAPQIPYFRTAKTYRRQIGRVAKTFC